MSNTEAPDLAALLARYQQAWTEGDIEGIISMTPCDGATVSTRRRSAPTRGVSASSATTRSAPRSSTWVWTGRDTRHEYGETHVVGDCAFALWTSVQDGPTGSETITHGADFYRFSDGMVAAKIAYRKNRQS